MRWFERYGVVGAYFIIISLCWVLGLSYFTDKLIEKFTYIAVFSASALLPLGYLLATLSQLVYYTLNKNQIHRRIINLLDKTTLEKLGLTKNTNEAICEARITAHLRLEKIDGFKLESLKYLGEFATPRFYVLAVNNSLILSTLLAPIISIITAIHLKTFAFQPNLVLLKSILAFSAVIIILLKTLNKILENQILEIHKVIWNNETVPKIKWWDIGWFNYFTIIYSIIIALYILQIK